MADKTVVVRFVSTGTKAVGQQVLGLAKANQQAANKIAKANAQVANTSKGIASASAFAGKAILLGIGAALAVSAAAAIDFESSMAGVFKTMGDTATADEIVALGEALREMSLDIPVNVNQLAAIAEIGGQLGVAIEDMELFVETVAMLGTATNMSFEDAAKGLARFSNIMQIPISEIGDLGDVLVHLGNNLAANESEILSFALRLAPIGKTVGASADEVMGLAAAFSQLGIPAERGATALQRTFIQIQSAVEGGGKSLEDFAFAARMSVEEFQSLSATGRFVALIDGLRSIEEEGGSALNTLDRLGISQQRTVNTLLGAAAAGDQFTKALRLSSDAAEGNNALAEEAARKWGTTAAQIQLLVNSFNDLRIEIGNGLIDPIRIAINFLRDFIAAIKSNIELVKFFGKALLAAAGIKGLLALIKGIGTAITNFKLFFSILRGTTAATQGISMMTLAMGGLTTAIGVASLAFVGFLAWQARNEAKMRALRDTAKEVNDLLEDGTSPEEAWGPVVESTLRSKSIDFLHSLGVSVADLTKSLVGAPDAARSWEELMDILGTGPGVKPGDIKQFSDVFDRIKEINPEFPFENWREWTATLTTEDFDLIRQGAISLSEDMNRLNDQNLAMALDYEQRKTEAMLNGDEERAREQEKALQEFDRIQQDGLERWVDTIQFMSDDAQKAWEDYRESTGEILSDAWQDVKDTFDDIREEILSGINIWEEYPKAVDLNITRAIQNMQRHIADLDRFTAVLQTLSDAGFGQEVIDRFMAMDFPTQLGIANLFETDPAQILALAEGFELYADEANRVTADRLDIAGTVQQEMNEAALAMVTEAEKLAEQGIDPWQAFMASVQEEMAGMDQVGRDALVAAIQGLGDSGLLSQLFGIGQNVIDSFIRGLNSKKGAIEGAMGGIANTTIYWLNNGIGAASPAKEFIKIGQYAGDGFRIGLEQSMLGDLSAIDRYVSTYKGAAAGAMGSVTQNETTNSYEINVSGTNTPRQDAQSLLFVAQVAGYN